MNHRLSLSIPTAIGCWLTLLATASGADSAPTAWELSPYRITVLAAIETGPSLSRRQSADLLSDLASRATTVVGGAWQIEILPAPAELRQRLLTGISAIGAESLPAAAIAGDKVFLLSVRANDRGHEIRAREFDTVTRLWNTTVTSQVRQAENLRHELLHCLLTAFAPQARIESVEGQAATLRLRAAALGRRDAALPALAAGVVFRPVLITSDAAGATRPSTAEPIAWTYLTPTGNRGALVTCRIDTGLAGPPLPEYHPSRQRWAVAVTPTQDSTSLKLVSQGNSAPLAGYEVVALPAAGGADQKAQSLGRSDRSGTVVVPPGSQTVRLLSVRQGDAALAHLPVVPGLLREISLPLPDASQRLEIESALAEVADGLLDLAARREALATRIRTAFANQEAEPALKLIQQLRALPGAEAQLTKLDQAQGLLPAVDPAARKRVQARVADLRKLAETLNAEKPVEKLEAELKGGSGAK